MAAAQVPTGTITGRVVDAQDRSVPGVTVTVTSPALQGIRDTQTTLNGDYVFRFLPPGIYTVVFELSGFAPQTETRVVAATETVALNVTMQPAGVAEEVTVSAEGNTFTNTVEVATNVQRELLDVLPTTRSLEAAVNLAPAVHSTGPGGNISIAGAMSFESLYMVNGVQVQDNIRGEPLDLYIEDAIQETTIATSGISAEYGRFTGGVVNAITRSGSNFFSGSFRTSFRNDDWRTTSPFEESKISQVVPTYEFTAGGPIVRDRTWFFVAGRVENADTSRETVFTNIPYVFSQDEQRLEFKGTQTLTQDHRLQVAYTDIRRSQQNSGSGIMDLASLTNPSFPENLLAVHYNATLGNNLFFEAQYSARNFTFKDAGGQVTDLIQGTTLSDNQTGAWYWSPQFCGVCGDEQRDNTSFLVKGSYLHSTANSGSHNVVFGYDTFNDRRTGDNHQSGSDWHIWTTSTQIVDGTVYPVVEPGFSTYIINWPILESSRGTNFRTHSFFVNDHWTFNRHFTFDLGLRYDRNAGRDASDNVVADDDAFSPRLGLVWDPTGTGRTTVNASFGKYVAAIASGVAESASPAGTPAILAYFYDGDPINAGDGPLVPTPEVIAQVFDWYNAAQPGPFQATIPGVAVRVDDTIRSPYSYDTVLGVSHQLSTNASVRIDFVNRVFGDFYAERIDTSTGQAADEFGQEFDVSVLENTNLLSRQYRGLNLQGSYRLGTGLTAGLSYTLSRLWGNVEGENIGSGPIPSSVLQYPEYRELEWAHPEGDLLADQRHRARLWATYDLPWGRDFVNTQIGVIQQVESGTPYGAAGSVLVDPFVENPGYAVLPFTMNYYFTDRDAFRTETMKRTDLSLRFSRRLGTTRAPELFAQFQVWNLFNQFDLFNISDDDINTTVLTAVDDGSLETFNPFVESPVEGVHWQKGDQFGEATSRFAYTTPRTFRFSVGVRF